MKNLAFVCCIIFSGVLSAQIDWKHTDGPFGSVLSSLFANEKYVFAPDYDFVFRSSDGIHWEKLNHRGTSIFAVSNDTIATIVRNFQSHFVQIHLSPDNGDHWIIRNLPLWVDNYFESIAISGSKIWLGCYQKGILLTSVDFGDSWSESPYPELDAPELYLVNQNLYRWGRHDLIQKDIHGSTWTSITPPLGLEEHMGDVKVLDSVLLVSTDDNVWSSVDNGAHWTKKKIFPMNNFFSYLAIAGSKLLSLTDQFLLSSSDTGITWDTLRGPTNIIEPGPFVAFKNVLMYATTERGIYRWDEQTKDFIENNDGLSKGFTFQLAYGGNSIYAACATGVFKYDIQTETWSDKLSAPTPEFQYDYVSTNDHGGVVVGTRAALNHFYFSEDYGETWKEVESDYHSGIAGSLQLVGDNIFIFGSLYPYRFSNHGQGWQEVEIEGIRTDVVQFKGRHYMASVDRLYSSADDGWTWEYSNTPVNETRKIGVYKDDIYVYGRVGDQFKLYISKDALHWTLIGEGNFDDMNLSYSPSFFRDAEHYYVLQGTPYPFPNIYSSIFVSEINSTSWSRLPMDFFGSGWVQDFLVVGDTIYVGGCGVYKTILSDPYLTATKEIPADLPSTFTITPNPASDKIQIHFSSMDFSGGFLIITNAEGKIVKSLPLNGQGDDMEVNIADLTSGIYFIKAGNTSRIVTQSFLKAD